MLMRLSAPHIQTVSTDQMWHKPVVRGILQKLASQLSHVGDIPPHLQNGMILLRLGEIKRVDILWTNMLLANDS